MQYRYRVLGKVEHSFILRGAYFEVGSMIDFHITDSELSFVKERCELTQIYDLTAKPKNSISNVVNAKGKEAQKQGSTAQNKVAQSNIQPKAELPSKRQYTKRTSVSNDN